MHTYFVWPPFPLVNVAIFLFPAHHFEHGLLYVVPFGQGPAAPLTRSSARNGGYEGVYLFVRVCSRDCLCMS